MERGWMVYQESVFEKEKSTWNFKKEYGKLLEFGMNEKALQACKDYLHYLEGRDAAETTRAQTCHKLKQFYDAVEGFEPKQLLDKRQGTELFLKYKQWMKNRGLSGYTVGTRLGDLRSFVYWHCRDEGLPKPNYLLDIKIELPKSARVSEENVLEFDQVRSLWQADTHPKNKAMVITAFESGMRLQEILDLRLKDLVEKHGTHGDYYDATFSVQKGKKNNRVNVGLIWSYPLIAEWLKIHPRKNEKEAFLFCNHAYNPKPGIIIGAQMGKPTADRMIKRVAKRAGITKPVSWHRIRHAAITYELLNDYTEPEVRAKHGYAVGSKALSIYAHLSSRNIKDKELRRKKIEPEATNGPQEPVMVYCPRCKEKNEESQKFCLRCGYCLDFDLRQEQEKNEIAELKAMVLKLAEMQGIVKKQTS